MEILTENKLHAPAIYHCAQAVEKCLKATHGYYLMKIEKMSEYDISKKFSRVYGHDLLISYDEITKSLLTLYIESEVKTDNKKQAYEPLRSMIKTAVSDISSTIRQFDNLVGNCIDGIMKQLKETSMA